jgi:deoxyinosine 3'endonuclease (endonuclease V)
VILDAQTGKIVYQDNQYVDLKVLYFSSFLAVWGIEPLQRLAEKQKQKRPDLQPAILVDGNGILHPRRAGLACFLGVRTGIPTIVAGKTFRYSRRWTSHTRMCSNMTRWKSTCWKWCAPKVQICASLSLACSSETVRQANLIHTLEAYCCVGIYQSRTI